MMEIKRANTLAEELVNLENPVLVWWNCIRNCAERWWMITKKEIKLYKVKLIQIMNDNYLSLNRKSNVQKELPASIELLNHVYE